MMTMQAHRKNIVDIKKEGSKHGSHKMTGMLALLACMAALAGVAGLSCSGLSVNSDVQTAPVEEQAQEFAALAPNIPPEIVNVSTATDRIAPLNRCELTCEAVDADGDELSYTWSASHGESHGVGPTIEWDSPDQEGLFRVSVVVEDGRGGTTDYSMSLHVQSNLPPEIQELSADLEWVASGKTAYFSCVTSDLDGDEVSHEWEATAGELFGSGTSVIWLAPEEEGSYWITVWARDAYGGEAKRAMPMSVTYRDPPTLARFRIKSTNSTLLKPAGDAWKIFQGGTCTIKCIVDQGDEPFTYEWSAQNGTLTSDGPVATWRAPGERASADIVVRVTDRHGSTATGSVLIYVETCGCAF